MLLDEVITAEFNIRKVVLWSRGQLAESTYLLKKMQIMLRLASSHLTVFCMSPLQALLWHLILH